MNAEKFGALWKYCGAHVKSLISGIQLRHIPNDAYQYM